MSTPEQVIAAVRRFQTAKEACQHHHSRVSSWTEGRHFQRYEVLAREVSEAESALLALTLPPEAQETEPEFEWHGPTNIRPLRLLHKGNEVGVVDCRDDGKFIWIASPVFGFASGWSNEVGSAKDALMTHVKTNLP